MHHLPGHLLPSLSVLDVAKSQQQPYFDLEHNGGVAALHNPHDSGQYFKNFSLSFLSDDSQKPFLTTVLHVILESWFLHESKKRKSKKSDLRREII